MPRVLRSLYPALNTGLRINWCPRRDLLVTDQLRGNTTVKTDERRTRRLSHQETHLASVTVQGWG